MHSWILYKKNNTKFKKAFLCSMKTVLISSAVSHRESLGSLSCITIAVKGSNDGDLPGSQQTLIELTRVRDNRQRNNNGFHISTDRSSAVAISIIWR